MVSFIVRRLLLSIIVLFIVTIIVFSFIQIIPGDPAITMLGVDAPREEIEKLRKELLLDRPIIVQYGHWLSEAVRGHFGYSLIYRREVSQLIAARLPVTLHLSIMGFIIGTLLGIIAGIICAVKRGTIWDSLIMLFANMGIGIPIFWLAMVGIYFFGVRLHWIPVHGYTSPLDDFWLSTKKTTLPIISIAIPIIAGLARQTRSSMLEVIKQDYVRTAWAKGLTERAVILKHSLKNALIPVVTMAGLIVTLLVGGQVLIETVFSIPGMGLLLVKGAVGKDFFIVQAVTLLIGVIVVFVNLLVDLSYGWLDPRIHYT
jgi:peptide/nickel transport system permease protein